MAAALARNGLTWEATLNEGGWANGDVYRVSRDGAPLVLKTYLARSAPFRAMGRYLLRRERAAYEALRGVTGVPALAAFDDHASLLIEHVDAEKISNALLAERGPPIVASLQQVLQDVHARGVYHMDLRNQGNILVAADSSTYIVDFASAVIVRGGHPGARLLAGLCLKFDRYGVSKWVERARDLG
ncbi:MAG: hypothetical protein AAGE01_15810 [Pseudomonadota bacterium]